MARPKKGQEKHAAEWVAFRIPSWMRAGLDRLAAERKAPLSDVANEALASYLKRHGIKAPAEGGRR
jgi:predicted transcriptional regulator